MIANTIYILNPTTGLYERNPDFDPAAFRAAHPDPETSATPRRYRSGFDDPDRDAPCLLDEIAALRGEEIEPELPDGTLPGEPVFTLFTPRYLIQPDDSGNLIANGLGFADRTDAVSVAMRRNNRDGRRAVVWDAVEHRAVIDLPAWGDEPEQDPPF